MQKIFLTMLVFAPVAFIAKFVGASSLTLFILSALAIVPLAKFIGEATESLASRTTLAVGGLLNATFGNATELIIGIFALEAGLVEVVRASIVGSILGNLTLVLGMAIICGGWKRKKQSFNMTAAQSSGSMLLLAVTALIIPAVFLQTSATPDIFVIEKLSILVSIIMILVYGASLLFSLHTHKHLYAEEDEEVIQEETPWSTKKSIIILLLATTTVAFMSEILVGSIEPLAQSFGWGELFIGVVFVAIIGNVAEHLSAITVAMKNKMNLALQISIGSATQIAMLVAPLLVLISLFFPVHMSLIFTMFELVALLFAVFIVNAVIGDGESTWLEGVQLVMTYIIVAIAFFFYR